MSNTATDRQRKSKETNAVATTIARALTLLADGYRVEPIPDRPGIYRCIRPPFRPVPAGCKPVYLVDVAEQHCECMMLEQHNVCKHVLGVTGIVAFGLYIASPYLPDTIASAVSALDIEEIIAAMRRSDDADETMFPPVPRDAIDRRTVRETGVAPSSLNEPCDDLPPLPSDRDAPDPVAVVDLPDWAELSERRPSPKPFTPRPSNPAIEAAKAREF